VSEQWRRIASLDTLCVGVAATPRLAAIMLHGYAMQPEALSPFAHSLGIAAQYYIPRGPVAADPDGRGWWQMDMVARAAAIACGPRDLRDETPPGLRNARRLLGEFATSVKSALPEIPLVVIGFSQGGMLACDALLHGALDVDALVLFSSSRINFSAWQQHTARVRGLEILVAHGRSDHDLAFSAGEGLRDFLSNAGARVAWVPFDGGHEIPLVAWRALKRLLAGVAHTARN